MIEKLNFMIVRLYFLAKYIPYKDDIWQVETPPGVY